jgi:glycosyltransferase involved in cell wall biosynthesis
VHALPILCERYPDYRLVIAGKVKRGHEAYWANIQRAITQSGFSDRVLLRIGHVPDRDIEMFFSAADLLAMPYVRIYQSGLPFLAYSFGLPVVCTDAGSLSEDVLEGVTGCVCRAADAPAFVSAMERFFASSLANCDADTRKNIREFAMQRYSWERVAEITCEAYDAVCGFQES